MNFFPSKIGTLFQHLVKILPICYPVIIYLGLKYSAPGVVGAGIAGLILLRILLQKKRPNPEVLKPLIPLAGLIILIFFINLFLNQELIIRMYPVIMNFGFFLLFVGSLFRPPSMIERFASMTENKISTELKQYTCKVTIVWSVFLAINTAISIYTVIFSSLEIWTLYNGFIAYLLMGLLFSGEYAIRLRILKGKQ